MDHVVNSPAENAMNAEILLTLKLQGKLFADPRRITLLKQIALTGSISQGAKLANISYKSAWDAVNEMNQLTEHTLVERATGGKGGGGAQLTTYGQRLIQLYDLLAQIQEKAFNVLHDESVPLDSLLGAIARFSLQTSARNQFFGTVDTPVNTSSEHITVLLADSKTRVTASLTQQSIDRLQLTPGKDVLALIKAPLINVLAHPSAESENCLAGTVISVKRSEQRSEILLKLDDGQLLCATVDNRQADQLAPQPDQHLWATFNAESVIIATLC